MEFARCNDGEASHGADSQFQFKAAGWSEMAPSNIGLGSSNQSVVEAFGGGVFAREEAKVSVGKHSSKASESSTVLCEFLGGSVGEEDTREVQIGSSLQVNDDSQPVCGDQGVAKVDQMDLEGEGEVGAGCC